jgi:hypothetical protein
MTENAVTSPDSADRQNEREIALITRHSESLSAGYYDAIADEWVHAAVDHATTLIPRVDLAVLIPALERRLVPANERQIAGALAMIGSAWPFAHQKLHGAVADLYATQLAEDLAGFPHDVIALAIRHLRRTSKFLPSIAELLEVCSERHAEALARLHITRQHVAEHNRRDAFAHRRVEQEARLERQREQDLSSLRQTFGDRVVDITADDLMRASGATHCVGPWLVHRWHEGVENGEAWVPQAIPLLAIAGRCWQAFEEGRLAGPRLCEAISAARTDLQAAERIIASPDADNGSGYHQHPGRHLGDIIRKLIDERTPAGLGA